MLENITSEEWCGFKALCKGIVDRTILDLRDKNYPNPRQLEEEVNSDHFVQILRTVGINCSPQEFIKKCRERKGN